MADLCRDTFKICQTCNAVLITDLAWVKTVIVRLAVSINLTAVRPRLLDQLRLPRILKRTGLNGS